MDEKIDVTSCCRLCLSTKLTFNIHTSKKYINSDLPPLDEIIKELTTIQIEKEEGETNLSKNICFSCNYLIIKLYSFRQQSIISNQKFQQAVKTWKKNQASAVFESESKNLLFADSLVAIYARCLVRGENKSSNKKLYHNISQMCKLPSKNNSISTCTTDSGSLSDSALSIALNEHIFRQSSNNQSCHPSVNKIIEENPNIILSCEAMNYNYDCSVVVETFKQLFRAALCVPSKISKQLDENINKKKKESCNLTKDDNKFSASVVSVNNCSGDARDQLPEIKLRNNSEQCSVWENQFSNKLLLEEHVDYCHRMEDESIVLSKGNNNLSGSVVSLNSYSDVASDLLSETKPRINSEQCSVCKRQFSNMLLLEEHVDYCHKMKNEAIVLTSQLRIPKKFKNNYLKSIKLIDNEERLRLSYKKGARKTVPVPKLFKSKKTATKSNSSITFKTLDIAESNELLKKLLTDTVSANISLNDARAELANNKINMLFSSINKSGTCNTTTNTPALLNSSNNLPASNLHVVSSTNQAALACTTNRSGVVNPENLPNAHSFANKQTITSTENNTLKEALPVNKTGVPTIANTSAVPNTSLFDYEIHRKKMLKSSLHVRKDTNENTETFNISSSSLLCQEYLPVNRPIINNDIVVPNVPLTVYQESVSTNPAPVVSKTSIPNKILKPNFYIDNTVNDSNLKRKNDETPSINPKRLKIAKNNSKRIFRDLQGCTSILEKLFAPQLDLEEILRKDLSESDLNEIDTSLINSAVCAYLRKNPRYFNLLEQLIGIRDLPVVVNISPTGGNTFDFIKAKCPSNNSDTPLIEMSRINWNNTCVLQNFSSTNKSIRVVGKSWQKKKINVPLSNWKQCATESLAVADKSITQSKPVDFEQLIDTNSTDSPVSDTSSFINSVDQLSNVNNQSLKTGSNQTCTPSETKKKSGDKIVFKRYLNFSKGKEESSKKVILQKNRNILPKPVAKYVIKDGICLKTFHATLVTKELHQVEHKQNGTSISDLELNLEEPSLRDGEIIEIEDDNDINNQNNYSTDPLIDMELGALKIVSVMSLNDDYNSSVEKTTESIADTEMNEYLNQAPIGIKNFVESYGILNPESESANLITNPTEIVSNKSTIKFIHFPENAPSTSTLHQDTNFTTEDSVTLENFTCEQMLQQHNDTPVSKPSSGISVLSPTRINLLLQKKELKM
ncbi:uncharacterized protein LOC123305463 [Chrysoperla carnea]|uniref:uncharacterized protein LOC123305463 n=1 Tax=Chrysoperla carnea TaxID=189513 RepID=UPI001D091430|nr:uncharacterized protein LOC123305463 [Chrysoperla carnea]